MRTLISAFVTTMTLSLVVGCDSKDDSTDTSDAASSSSDDTGDDTSGSAGDGDANLIGIGFNTDAGTYELRSVDPDTALVSSIASIEFDEDGFSTSPGVLSDSEAGLVYAFSGAGTLYSIAMDGSSVEEVGGLNKTLQHVDVGIDSLIGIGYNPMSGLNVLRSVDLDTAEVTDLKSFAFDNDYWYGYVVNDPAAGVVYAVSMSDTLYRLQMDGSGVEEVGTLTQGIQHMGLGVDGLIGVGYNNTTGLNEVRSVNTETAEVTTLTQFAFDTGEWQPWVITDPKAGVFYAVSSASTLYRLQMDGSGVETIGQISDQMLGAALGAY
jgi:hypothetical protein